MVTDRVGTRVVSEVEQADPQLRAQIEACERANGSNCLVAPVLGEPRNVFEQGVDEVVAVALLTRLEPGLHFGSCRLTGPNSETFVRWAPFTVAESYIEAGFHLNGWTFPLHEAEIWAPGVWQIEVTVDGAILARPTFTIRGCGETSA